MHKPASADRGISIHVLRVEDDLNSLRIAVKYSLFQSTSSVWRTTVLQIDFIAKTKDFNPRPPCGGRLPTPPAWRPCFPISIHVLRVEDDVDNFQRALDKLISIHVLRVEDDPATALARQIC